MAIIQANQGLLFRRVVPAGQGEPDQVSYIRLTDVRDPNLGNALMLSGAVDNLGAGNAQYTLVHDTYTGGSIDTNNLPNGSNIVNYTAGPNNAASINYVAPTMDDGGGGGSTPPPGGGGGNGSFAPASFAAGGTDINTGFVGDPLGERDPMAAFQAALGVTGRPLSDPFRRYVGSQFETFFRPFQYQNVLSGVSPNMSGTLPGFQEYIANIGGSLGAARQNAANVFNQLVGGGGGSDIQNLLSGNVARETPFLGLTDELQTTLGEIGQLAQQGMRGRLGSAAANVLGRFAPSASDLYQDYFLRNRAGEQVAPTFGQALQAAYGLG